MVSGPVQHVTGAELVQALHGVFGAHQARAAHAKGVLLQATFMPTPEAHELCKAALFENAIIHAMVRFSDSAGIPTIPDTDPLASPRGFAIKFRLLDGSHADVLAHSYNGFPVATADEFVALFRALAASGPDAPKPTALDRFLDGHPIAKRFLTGQKPPPESFATIAYFGVNAFRFIDASGRTIHVRYRLVPQAGERFLDPAGVAARGPNYLAEEVAERVAKAPIAFDWLAQVAGPGDAIDDPSRAWPEDRKLVKLGTIAIVRTAFDQASLEKALIFSPGNVLPGIEPADPMIAARDDAYGVSFEERR